MNRVLPASLLALGLCALPVAVSAQKYPARSVRVVVPVCGWT
jgi:tripartite-type tricarboxylate transporter receptor subunit TctC